LRRNFLAALPLTPDATQETAVEQVIDRIISTFGMMRSLNEETLTQSREVLTSYIEKLSSAGETDAQRLAVFGLAYLRELHDGRSEKFTGC
jgi:hypothetical protein